jgi:hypothetical protein
MCRGLGRLTHPLIACRHLTQKIRQGLAMFISESVIFQSNLLYTIQPEMTEIAP